MCGWKGSIKGFNISIFAKKLVGDQYQDMDTLLKPRIENIMFIDWNIPLFTKFLSYSAKFLLINPSNINIIWVWNWVRPSQLLPLQFKSSRVALHWESDLLGNFNAIYPLLRPHLCRDQAERNNAKIFKCSTVK